MLNLPQETLNSIKRFLLRKQKEVEEDLKQVEKDDPVLTEEVAEASEPGTDSWRAEGHSRILALGGELKSFGGDVKNALLRIKSGTYGHCLNCNKHIETTRLLAMPTAKYCLSCSKKINK